MDISLKDLQQIDERFYKKISEEWERVSNKGFGDPALKIYSNKDDERSTLITVIIVMQNNPSIYTFFKYEGEKVYQDVHLTSGLGEWIGKQSKARWNE